MSLEKVIVSSPHAPAAIGPYSQAVKYGNVMYVSGCIGVRRELNALVPGGVGPEARQALENLKHVVEAGGCTLEKVLKCTVLLADMSYFAEINAIYAEYFPHNPPARACYAVKGLPLGAMIEIEAICGI